MRYYLIAGEASGDLHASNLMRALKTRDTEAVFRCWGGDRMQAEGGELVKHYRDLAFMGFLEVAINLRTILGNLSFCRKDLLEWKPDALILVDYPGFNLRIAEYAHKKGLKVFYYISPQVWAWKKNRVLKIKKSVNRMFTILPFEKSFYEAYGYDVDFVGHPLLDAIHDFRTGETHKSFRIRNKLDDRKIIALLPGSRRQEISRMLPLMLETASSYPGFQAVVAGMRVLPTEAYATMGSFPDVRIVYDETYDLLLESNTAIVTSGTASLETALFGVPQVIAYKGSPISYAIAKRLVDVKYIGLPNLVMDREIVRELVQQDFNPGKLKEEVGALWNDEGKRERIMRDYTLLEEKLGGPGASRKTAEGILAGIKKT